MPMAHKSIAALMVIISFLPGAAIYLTAQTGPPTVQGQTGMPANPGAGRASVPISSGALRNPGLTAIPPDFSALKLAPGYLVSVNVLDDSDFDGNFRVDQQGDLTLPIIGPIHVVDKTANEARQQIQQKLQTDEILKNPQVNLNILEYAALEVTIMGEVAAPGRYPLFAPRSLTDVLALAGGVTPAAGNEVLISPQGRDSEAMAVHYSRGTGSKSVEGTVVHPGDTVQIKRAGIVYVLGAVNRPGGYVMQEDGTLTVLEAISIANGTTMPASVGTIILLRRSPDGTAARIELPLSKMQRGKYADMALRATDILYVPTSKVKAALINSQGILSAATSAGIYAGVVY